jgi:Raf kinase inhibitor-like YbhB/YbcL family protein
MKQLNLLFALLLLSNLSIFAQETFTLRSKTLSGQATITQEFNGFGCVGKNESPQLSWSNAPKGTQSFAVTMYDPDAPTGSGWWHWLVFDLPANTRELPANAGNITLKLSPIGSVQSVTDYGKPGYGGPCPPKGHGDHRYIITVYALKVKKLGLDAKTTPAIVGYYLNNNALAKASIIAYYKRD